MFLKRVSQISTKTTYSFTYGMNEYIIQALIVNRSNVNSSKIMNPVRSTLRKIGLNQLLEQIRAYRCCIVNFLLRNCVTKNTVIFVTFNIYRTSRTSKSFCIRIYNERNISKLEEKNKIKVISSRNSTVRCIHT
jgi:hypothetical protein